MLRFLVGKEGRCNTLVSETVIWEAISLQMMKKILTLWAACTLPMVAPLGAREPGVEITKIQEDRERLIDLVLNLESDFGKTLEDYTKLQKEYATLLNRPTVPDQSGKVKELQKQLAAAVARLKAPQKDQGDVHAQELLEQDLVNLRNELHLERQELLVAKARLLRVKQLEGKNKSLQETLKKDSANRAETMGQLQAVRGERDALLVKIKGLMTRVEEAEKGHKEAKAHIAGLEKETNLLKQRVQSQEVELRKLRVDQAHSKGAMAAAVDLRKEQDRLGILLATREKELKDLREDLAVEMKRSLDVPVLIKARDDLQKKLSASSADADGLKKKNKTLTEKQASLQKEIEVVQKSITLMQADLVKNKKAMTAVTKLNQENQALISEQEKLQRTIAMAKAELVKSRSALQMTEAKLAESVKLAECAGLLNRQNAGLLAQVELHRTQVATAKADMDVMKKRIAQNSTAMKDAVELGQKVEVLTAERGLLNSKLEETKAAHLDVEAKLKTAQASLMKKGEMAETAKKAIAESDELRKTLTTSQAALKKAQEQATQAARLKKDYDALTVSAASLEKQKSELSDEVSKRDAELKMLRAEMAQKPDMTEDLAKLQKEKDKLAAELAKREEDLKTTRGELGRLQLDASVAQKQLATMMRETAQIDPVRYAKGEADVTAQQARVLTQVQKVLQLFPDARFEVVGHTCDLGSAGGNLRLSQQRAQALHDFLLEKGVKEERLKFRGVGQADPMVPNTSEANRRQNRRVVVEILD
ncbi:MAG: outer membrane protein OmpA-like peptidoglycan-associated protein [Paracoccaceae bacterium]